MSLAANRGRLAALTKQLNVAWVTTKDTWRDAKSDEFEKRYMEELMVSVNRAVASIERLDRVISKVRSDCE